MRLRIVWRSWAAAVTALALTALGCDDRAVVGGATDSGVDLICGHHVFPISPRTTWPVRFAPVAWLQP
jgi:hypothetical protein